MEKRLNQKGFTLIEILVVIGIIAILAAVIIIAINPARQFAQARNSQRTSNVNSLINAVGQYMADNKGNLSCFATAGLDAADKEVSSTALNIRSCIVPNYMSEIPVDPKDGTAYNSATGAYNTKYTMSQDATTKRITVKAPSAELGETIQITR